MALETQTKKAFRLTLVIVTVLLIALIVLLMITIHIEKNSFDATPPSPYDKLTDRNNTAGTDSITDVSTIISNGIET